MADVDLYAPPDSPGWMTLSALHPQTSWLFYAVVSIRGSYLPVAVTAYSPEPADSYPERIAAEHRSDKVTGVIHGHQIASKALACVRILSDSANRQQVTVETDLASELYQDLSSVLTPEFVLQERREDLRQAVLQEEGEPRGVTLPFIQKCLEHGAASDPIDASLAADCWLTMPLQTTYRRHPCFGVVVIDVTDPGDVGYGIVASLVRTQTRGPYVVEPEEGDPPGMIREQSDVRQVLVGDQRKFVLSVDDYLKLADSDGSCCSQPADRRIKADIESLSKMRTVGMEALYIIWPDRERTVETLQPASIPVNSLLEKALRGETDTFVRSFPRSAVDCVISQTRAPWAVSRRPTLQRFYVDHWQMGAEAWVARLLGWLRHRNSNGRALACGPVKLDAMDAMAMSPKLYPDSPNAVTDTNDSDSGAKWKLIVVVRTSSHGNHRVQYCFACRKPDADADAGENAAWQVEDAQGFLEMEAPGTVDKGLLEQEERVTRQAILAWPKKHTEHNRKPLSAESVLEALSWEHDGDMIRGLLQR